MQDFIRELKVRAALAALAICGGLLVYGLIVAGIPSIMHGLQQAMDMSLHPHPAPGR